jgi:hypothetical protein
MKVARTGMLAWFNGHATLNGWTFIGDGPCEGPREALKAALIHIAGAQGIHLAEAPEPAASECFDLDSERAALDAIAIARWRDSGETS